MLVTHSVLLSGVTPMPCEGEVARPELGNLRFEVAPHRASEALVAEMTVAELEARVRAAQ